MRKLLCLLAVFLMAGTAFAGKLSSGRYRFGSIIGWVNNNGNYLFLPEHGTEFMWNEQENGYTQNSTPPQKVVFGRDHYEVLVKNEKGEWVSKNPKEEGSWVALPAAQGEDFGSDELAALYSAHMYEALFDDGWNGGCVHWKCLEAGEVWLDLNDDGVVDSNERFYPMANANGNFYTNGQGIYLDFYKSGDYPGCRIKVYDYRGGWSHYYHYSHRFDNA